MTNNMNVEPKRPKDVVKQMYQNYFLDYASYVILERAIPGADDGLKPVQRRILHSMHIMDDGRYHKVANIIGQTMQYHPHGDAAIGDALVNLGQKDLLIDCQGNWGDVRTGDSAAAPRYIEARLSKFALDIAFNPKTTKYQRSYDGRKKEPLALPMKFPLLLAQGVEGIAVGLSTKIMPHNFVELIQGSIDILRGKKTQLIPDFPTGGLIDASNYNGGKRGGKIRVRAKIDIQDRKTLLIKEIPYTTTTTSLIDSIIKANNKSKIKIKRVIDNTAKDVEIMVELPSGVSPEMTVDALYAFTDCEVSVSPNACVVLDDAPIFTTVDELLHHSTIHTKNLLEWELKNKQEELENKWHFASLEKIFIENRIYLRIEECETWEAVIEAIKDGLKPFLKILKRPLIEEDIIRLTEIKIKRISKFDINKAEELIVSIEEELAVVNGHLNNLVRYAIDYFKTLLKKHGKGKERKTELATFDNIQAAQVAVNNAKLYVNRKTGFIGTGLKKDEFIEECSDIDDIIIFHKDGTYFVSKVADKLFVGKDPIHVAVWRKQNKRMIYNLIYTDLTTGVTYAKRFPVLGVTRDRKYTLYAKIEKMKIQHFSANPNGEAEVVNIQLSQGCTAKNKNIEFDFATLEVKGRNTKGNIATKYPVRRVKVKEKGVSTLGAIKIWMDETTGRLSTSELEFGRFLGEFEEDNLILAIYNDGTYELTNYDWMTNRYEVKDLAHIALWEPETPIAAVYYDGERKATYVKRFLIETSTLNQRFEFLPNTHRSTNLLLATLAPNARIAYQIKTRSKKPIGGELNLAEFSDVKGWKSIGNKLSDNKLSKVALVKRENTKKDNENQIDLF